MPSVLNGRPAVRVLGELHAQRQVKRMQAKLLQTVRQLLDTRLVLNGRVFVVLARFACERVLSVLAVHPEQVLGPDVVRLNVVVTQRPGRRDTVRVLDLAEVCGQQPEQRRAVHLRVAAHVVMQLGPEGPVVQVVEGLVGRVFRVAEDGAGVPVVPLSREKVTAFEQQHALARFGHARRGGRAPRPAADDQDVVVVIPHGQTNPPLA
jgi:hypothetical protein